MERNSFQLGPVLLLLLLCLCQTASSDGSFSVRLDKYRNPNSVLSNNEKCDTFGSFSPCDMRFTISLRVGSDSRSFISPEYSDSVEVNNFYAFSTTFAGTFPTAADNWHIRVEVADIDPAGFPEQMVDDFTMNEAFASIRSASSNGAAPGFTTVTTNLAHSRSLIWSHQLYCSVNYYSQLCDKFCKPTDNSVQGHYSCSDTGDKVCLKGYWDPATNCMNTYCSGTSLCQNNGSCNAIEDTYYCNCAATANFTGRHCELPRNPCAAAAPCRNGTCSSPNDGTYTCACHTGWGGTNCDADINECAGGSGGCNLAGTANCTNLIGSFVCSCRSGWFGERCTEISDYCAALSPCLHGGCSNSNSSSGSNYTCTCRTGWDGTNCDRDIDECSVAGTGGFGSCYLPGTAACVNRNGSFACECRPGWAGPLCGNISDYCQVMKPTCSHGNCSNRGSNYTCICDSGWEGAACEADIDECSRPGYCQNRLSCVNTNGSYVCHCMPGFEGPRCDTRPSPCVTERPCAHGNCTLVAGSDYSCSCGTGWEGRNCTADRNECLAGSDPCAFGQACINLLGGYRCDQTAASYWWVFLIIFILLLLAAAAIVGWRVIVCRQRDRSMQLQKGRNYTTAETVSARRNVKWPADDRRTLDDWAPGKAYYYREGGEKSPTVPPRNPNRPMPPVERPHPMPPLAGEAEYELVRTRAAAELGAYPELEESNQYADLRKSKMLGTGEEPEPLNQNHPKPPVPNAPRPTQKLPQSTSSGSSDHRFESVYDNSGYMSSNPPSRPVSNPGYLIMTNNPDGYVRPISISHDQQSVPLAQQLPPKPPKVKRTKPKKPPPMPPTPQTPVDATAVEHKAVDVPEIHLVDVDGVDAGPPPITLGRPNSSDADAQL